MPGPEPACNPDDGTQADAAVPAAAEDPHATLAPSTPGGLPCGPGSVFGDYELHAELGRGGMGIVFKARQISLDRVVALKMVLSGKLSSASAVRRFRTEAEAAARLSHGNIVQVYEVGEIDGCHFYSMEYINGSDLTRRLEEGPLPGKLAARYLMIIARALHHAHRNGILHRDLKPSNLLLDTDDQPHITDFGLAKKLDDVSKTRSGAILGTPCYMAPEQAAGRSREVGPVTDVYSLGAVLYELLTCRPPFQSETPLDTIMQVIEKQPVPPRLLNPKIERDLETICLKCLEKDPKHRYASAEELAADLNRYLNGESIAARSFNVLDQLVRTFERNQYLSEFHAWGNMLILFAGIILVEHLAVFALIIQGPPYPRHWIVAARAAQFTLMGLLFWRHRRHTLLPTSAAERQLWTIWIGYLIACTMTAVVHGRLIHAAVEHGWATAKLEETQVLTIYPFWAVLTGLAFFVMGNNYWGRCYGLAFAFFLLAVLMLLVLEWASLLYGLVWAAALSIIGYHLRWISARSIPGDLLSPHSTVTQPSSRQSPAES